MNTMPVFLQAFFIGWQCFLNIEMKMKTPTQDRGELGICEGSLSILICRM